jgi:hypothetical protein
MAKRRRYLELAFQFLQDSNFAENAWLSQCAEISVRSLSDVPSNKKSAILLTAVAGEIAS